MRKGRVLQLGDKTKSNNEMYIYIIKELRAEKASFKCKESQDLGVISIIHLSR